MTPVRLEPVAPRSRVKHSTTEPLPSHFSWWGGQIHCFVYKMVLVVCVDPLNPSQQIVLSCQDVFVGVNLY